jgi:hypothetical protein
MLGNPDECRDHAKRCLALAMATENPILKERILDVAQAWSRLVTDLEATKMILGSADVAPPPPP